MSKIYKNAIDRWSKQSY